VRNRRQESLPRRLAAEFLIAAQAEHFNMKVLTFDRTVHEAAFPGLTVLP
jgi:predicted nucleic acid-binding protein